MFKGPIFHATTPKFTRLHQAAADGNVKAIRAILSRSPDSVYNVDESGLTPLHHAVLNGHLNAVKALTPNGEALFVLDNDGYLPISYANSELHPDIVDYLMEMNSYPSLTTNIHFAAIEGNIDELKRLLEDPKNLEETNIDGFTPLMYAIISNQKKAAELLVRAGANVDVLDSLQNDLVSLAKGTPILEYTKRICGLTPNTIHHLRQQFQAIIEREMRIAAEQNKQLLIILGETHYIYKILQIEKMIFQIAKNVGIDNLLVEQRPEVEDLYPSDAKGKKLGMNVVAIDHSSLEATMEERNTQMTKAIFDANRSAVVRIGSDHLQGILEMPGNTDFACAFQQRFHRVPFNLSTILNNFTPPTTEAQFGNNENHTILVKQQGISRPEAALRRWNTQQKTAGVFNTSYRSLRGAPQASHKHQAEEEATSSAPKRKRKK